jgi:hypothetical protein
MHEHGLLEVVRELDGLRVITLEGALGSERRPAKAKRVSVSVRQRRRRRWRRPAVVVVIATPPVAG